MPGCVPSKGEGTSPVSVGGGTPASHARLDLDDDPCPPHCRRPAVAHPGRAPRRVERGVVGPAGHDRRGHQDRPLPRPLGLPGSLAARLGPAGDVGRTAEPGLRVPVPHGAVLRPRLRDPPDVGGPAVVVDGAAHRRLPVDDGAAAGVRHCRGRGAGDRVPRLRPGAQGHRHHRRTVVRGACATARAGNPAPARDDRPRRAGGASGGGAQWSGDSVLWGGERDGDGIRDPAGGGSR